MGIFGDASSLSIVGFILSIVAFVLQLVGFATPYWQYASSVLGKTYQGLWQLCISALGQTECSKITCDTGGLCKNFKGAQAMETLSFIVLLAAVVLVAVQIFVMKDKKVLKQGGAVCCIIGGVLALIGVIIYATIDGLVITSNLHFSFAFCIIAAIGGVVSGVLLLIG